MKRIVRIVTYVAGVAQAIAKGFSACAESWPIDNPFKKVENEQATEKQ